VVRERLDAKKTARLVELRVKGKEPERRAQIAHAAAAEVSSLRTAGAKVIGVVVNRVDTARLVHRALSSDSSLGRVVLVTGRMRPLDRDRVVAEELCYADAARDRSVTEPVIVVATQCIEAGADLDFDALVTELASFDALKQRFGRLDRRGQVTTSLGHAPAVIFGRSDMLESGSVDAVYGSSLAATWSYLQTRVASGVVDLGVSALSANPPAPELAATLVPQSKRAPVLLPGHIDAWTQTSPLLRPDPDPDVALWLHGPERESAEVQIVWRADLLDDDLARWGQDRERDEGVQESLTLVRPSTLEALSLPLHAARAWLEGEAVPAIADVLAEASTEERRRSGAVEAPVALLRRDEVWRPAKANELRPGDVVVVPATRGGLRAGSFDPEASEQVLDLGDLAQLRGRGVLSLRTHPEALRWLHGAPPPPKPSEEGTPRDDREALEAWLGALEGPAPTGVREREWLGLRTTKLRRDPVAVKARSEGGEQAGYLILVQRLARDPKAEVEIGEAYTDDDRSSFTSSDLGLRQHSSDVRTKVELFVRALGLPESVARDVALAGWLHDVGKVDPRFQLMLAGGDEVRLASLEEPLAKSRLPNMSGQKWKRLAERAALPQGYRHELSSLAMIEVSEQVRSRASDFDLVLHLVASHHGWCRPFAPASPTSLEGAAPDLSFDLPGDGGLRLRGSAEHAYAALDGGVADRFWRVQERYGAWGLAWLEAILRLADHRASEDVEERGARR
jgi:CRISPR-associated endonuclease/helicase Cas3